MNKKIDVIVVGAGPAGIAAGVTIARGGKSVVVLERASNFGTKNMFGGAIYLKSIMDLFPKNYESAPLERKTIKHSWGFLTQNDATSISYETTKNDASASVFRPKFDSWMVERAKEEGVYFAPSTLVRELIEKDGAIIGVKTDLEEFYAPVTIIAEGAKSLLAQSIGLVQEITPKDMILGVKEVYKMPPETIEARFNLGSNTQNGAILEFFGGFRDDIFSITYLYTFKNHIALGIGVLLDDLARFNIKPYELLDEIKLHPSIKNYIEGGESVEYSAHLIPEFGFNKMPKLYKAGVMLVGDSAGFVNPVHFEGTNLAIYSGIYAGETALFALNKGDFSEKTLKMYKEKVLKSFIGKDLKSYRNVVKMALSRRKTIFNFIPDMMSEFFAMFTSADSTPKNKNYQKFIKKALFSRKISELIKDCYEFAKTFIEVVK